MSGAEIETLERDIGINYDGYLLHFFMPVGHRHTISFIMYTFQHLYALFRNSYAKQDCALGSKATSNKRLVGSNKDVHELFISSGLENISYASTSAISSAHYEIFENIKSVTVSYAAFSRLPYLADKCKYFLGKYYSTTFVCYCKCFHVLNWININQLLRRMGSILCVTCRCFVHWLPLSAISV